MCSNISCASTPDKRAKIKAKRLCHACYGRLCTLRKLGLEPQPENGFYNIEYLPNGNTLYWERVCIHRANELAARACIQKYLELATPRPKASTIKPRAHRLNKPRGAFSNWLVDFESLLIQHRDIQALGAAIREIGLYPFTRYFT